MIFPLFIDRFFTIICIERFALNCFAHFTDFQHYFREFSGKFHVSAANCGGVVVAIVFTKNKKSAFYCVPKHFECTTDFSLHCVWMKSTLFRRSLAGRMGNGKFYLSNRCFSPFADKHLFWKFPSLKIAFHGFSPNFHQPLNDKVFPVRKIFLKT